MEFLKISQCSKLYDFNPLKPWPSGLPAIAFNDELVAGFKFSTSEIAINHKGDSKYLTHIFCEIYPDLSMCELARLHLLKPAWCEWDSLCEFHGYTFNNVLTDLFEKIVLTPIEFQNWMSEKDLRPYDLAILDSCTPSMLNEVFQKILSDKLSKSTGSQCLELAGELLLSGKTWSEINVNSGDEWLKHLRTLRYPNATKSDSQSIQQINTIPWPAQAQAKWVRRGDKAGVELKLFFGSPHELQKNIVSLERIDKILNENPGKLWPQ